MDLFMQEAEDALLEKIGNMWEEGMQAPIGLCVGVHSEQSSALTFVLTMLAQAGHRYLIDSQGLHSLANYLNGVFEQAQQAPHPPYDLLILMGVDADALSDYAVIAALARLQAFNPVPIMVITNVTGWQLQAWELMPNMAVLAERSLTSNLFLQTLGRLTQRSPGIPNPLFGYARAILPELRERLIEEERSRIAVRQGWLAQRQEWLAQRKTWLEQRQAWLEARENEKAPQHEWLLEQRARLKQQRSDIEDQERKVRDLRRWLNRYRRRIDEEYPHPKGEMQ